MMMMTDDLYLTPTVLNEIQSTDACQFSIKFRRYVYCRQSFYRAVFWAGETRRPNISAL